MDEAAVRFYGELFGIIRTSVPMRKRRRKLHKNQPWWNADLRHLRNRLRKSRKRYFKRRSESRKTEMRDTEAQYNSLNARCFRDYIHRIEDNVKADPKSFWNYVNDRKSTKGIPQNMRYQGMTTTTQQESANMFSSYFQSVSSNNSPPLSVTYLDSIPQYDVNVPRMNFSPNDVLLKLQSIDGSKGAGPDQLPPFVVKHCANSLALPASILFNRSLNEKCFPTIWKSASITPIHKSGSLNDVENYRGISILSCLPKIFESLVHDVLYQSTKCIISTEQHGFMKKRSTTTNLLSYVSTLVNRMEKRQQVDAVYVDFAKAFDKVPHILAVEKFKRIGLPEWLTQWILSYLTGRSSSVKVGESYSVPFQVHSGVPQGSILGPLLFVLFINDLCMKIKSPKSLYADDLKFYRVITSLVDCCALQTDIDGLLEWCSLNGMEANIKKCCVITFSRSRTPIAFEYRMETCCLKRTSTVKDLGILVDSKLRFVEHIASVTAKAYSLLGFLKRNTKFFEDVYSLKTLYCSLVRSVLEYGVQVWAPYHAVHINRIERIQKNFVRYALRGLHWRDRTNLPSYESRCMLIDLPTLSSRRVFLQRMLIFDVLTDHIDCADILEKLRFNTPFRVTRQPEFFRRSNHRTDYGMNNPLDVCCNRFNEVSNMFDFGMTKTVFKLRISR